MGGGVALSSTLAEPTDAACPATVRLALTAVAELTSDVVVELREVRVVTVYLTSTDDDGERWRRDGVSVSSRVRLAMTPTTDVTLTALTAMPRAVAVGVTKAVLKASVFACASVTPVTS